MTATAPTALLAGRRLLVVDEGGPEGSLLFRALAGVARARAPEAAIERALPAELTSARAAGADALVLLPRTIAPFAPLDVALEATAQLAERALFALGGAPRPVVLLSHLEVLGAREGALFEGEPDKPAYPLERARGAGAFQVAAELARARALVGEEGRRLQHADVTSRLMEAALTALSARKEPTRGRALEEKVSALRAEEHARRLEARGKERAEGWGFRTTRGYALALAEQLLAEGEAPLCAVRAGPLGAARRYPAPGALPEEPALLRLLAALREGPVRLQADAGALVELLPLDDAAGALLLAAAAALGGAGPRVLHASATPKNPLRLERLFDLYDLSRRRRQRDRPLHSAIAPLELAPKARALASAARLVSRAASFAASQAERRLPPARALARPLTEPLAGLAPRRPESLDPGLLLWREEQRLAAQSLPVLERRLRGAGAEPLCDTQGLEWRRYLLETHLPALEAHLSEAAPKAERPLFAYENLLLLLEEAQARAPRAPALSRFEGARRDDVSYEELLSRARATARRLLEAGLAKGERVLLSGENHPAWATAAFGILFAGGVLVPVDPGLAPEQAANIARRARVRLCLVDKKARRAFGSALEEAAPLLDLSLSTVSGPEGGLAWGEISPDDVASVLFTSGTTGEPKGVVLSHGNFTALAASLGGVFDMSRGDRLLSVLPLHHTFEFSCGLLLPLAAGAQVFYLDELTGERLLFALKEGRITAMVGVPALWQLLERRLRARLEERKGIERAALDAARAARRLLAEELGVDIGALLFRRVHEELGGHLRTLISGGAALPKETHALFAELGLPLAEGYGLTEAAPVLSVAKAGGKAGTVGAAIPGVELSLRDVDERGIGEVVARGPNVMQGYFEDEAATRQVLEGGFLRTGDLGRFDEDGELVIVGRAKDVVVTAAGENVYLDDVEARLKDLEHVRELCLTGLFDARGGERLALAYVPADGASEGAARASIDEALRKLPVVFRPSVVRCYAGAALPRTATLKVKRREVRHALEEALLRESEAARPAEADGDGDAVPLAAARAAVALVSSRDPGELSDDTRFLQDLGFDSLMWVELQGALSPLFGPIDAEVLYALERVVDLERYLRTSQGDTARARAIETVRGEDTAVRLPALVTTPARRALSFAQTELYRTLYDTEVEGRAHIPYNRAAIVVANHCSHLDTGLVKYALGRYGEALTPLAAKDYFFEGHPLKVAFFEHLTNLAPIDRETGSGLAFEQAVSVVEEGRVVLIFPEGTRREDGTLGEFKPLVGRLSLRTGAPVLPLHLSGTYEALPRGARLPRPGVLKARIGPPLFAEDLARLTADQGPVEAARTATGLIREAILALGEGRALELGARARRSTADGTRANARASS